LLALDQKANEAFFRGDGAHFEGMLSDKFVDYYRGNRHGKAEITKMIDAVKCDVKEGWKLEDPQMSRIDSDTYVLSYKGTFDGTCTTDGRSEPIPSPVRAATVWVRNGDQWQAAFHGETLIMDADSEPPAAGNEGPAQEAPEKDDMAASNSNTAAPAKPSPSANTDALVKIHAAGWEAWKAKDAKWFNDNMTADAAHVDPAGRWFSGKADLIKQWTETMKCEGVNNVSVSDGFASALSPTAEILTLKGTADGTCDGQKNGTLYSTAVYVKEGDSWKLAFLFETPAM
jgi:ketosteroid isomerase-like protein